MRVLVWQKQPQHPLSQHPGWPSATGLPLIHIKRQGPFLPPDAVVASGFTRVGGLLMTRREQRTEQCWCAALTSVSALRTASVPGGADLL